MIPTRGGGRAVQFTDVEKLKSEDPLSSTISRSKRRVEDDPTEYSGEWTDVETRVSYITHLGRCFFMLFVKQ